MANHGVQQGQTREDRNGNWFRVVAITDSPAILGGIRKMVTLKDPHNGETHRVPLGEVQENTKVAQ